MNAIVKNIKHWHTNILDYKDNIKQDVEHNYNLFINNMQQMIENVNTIDDIDLLVDYTEETLLKNRPDLRLTS
jgi:phage I-like protein